MASESATIEMQSVAINSLKKELARTQRQRDDAMDLLARMTDRLLGLCQLNDRLATRLEQVEASRDRAGA